MKRKFVQTFENFESGKVNVPVDYWKSDSSGGAVSEPKDGSTQKLSTDGGAVSEPKDGSTQKLSTDVRDNLVEKYGEDKTEKIIKFFDNLFKDLKETTSEKYPDSVFFYTLNGDGSKKVWMEQDSKNGKLWCRWSGFWSFFENELVLNYSETQSLVKTMVGQHLNCQVGTPLSPSVSTRMQVGQHLNCQVGTPTQCVFQFCPFWWDNI